MTAFHLSIISSLWVRTMLAVLVHASALSWDWYVAENSSHVS